MLMEPTPTQFDLNFRLGRIPVRIHPTFWLFTGLLGWMSFQNTFGNRTDINILFCILIWIAASFLSILVHELGHVLAGIIFGERGYIVLHFMGGVAVGNWPYLKRWQRIVLYLAGPGAGFLLYGLARLLDHYVIMQTFDVARWNPYMIWFFVALYFMTLLVNLMNLIPVFPLDGGQVMREICTAVSPRKGNAACFSIGFAISMAIALYSLAAVAQWQSAREITLPYPGINPTFSVILFGMLAIQNWQMLQMERARNRDDYFERW